MAPMKQNHTFVEFAIDGPTGAKLDVDDCNSFLFRPLLKVYSDGDCLFRTEMQQLTGFQHT